MLAIIQAPNLAVMDWELPGCLAVEVLSEIKAGEYPPYIVVLSKDINISQTALDAGADRFLEYFPRSVIQMF